MMKPRNVALVFACLFASAAGLMTGCESGGGGDGGGGDGGPVAGKWSGKIVNEGPTMVPGRNLVITRDTELHVDQNEGEVSGTWIGGTFDGDGTAADFSGSYDANSRQMSISFTVEHLGPQTQLYRLSEDGNTLTILNWDNGGWGMNASGSLSRK